MKGFQVFVLISVFFFSGIANAAIVQLSFSGTTQGVKSWSNTGASWDGAANIFTGSFSYDNDVLMGSGDGIWTSRFYDAITSFSVSVNQGSTFFDHNILMPYDTVTSSEIYQSFNGFNYVDFETSKSSEFWNLYMELNDSVTGFANNTLDLDKRSLIGGGYFVFTLQNRALQSGLTFNGVITSTSPLVSSSAAVSSPSSFYLLIAGIFSTFLISYLRKNSSTFKSDMNSALPA